MKFKSELCLIGRMISLVGVALLLIPVMAQALPPSTLTPAAPTGPAAVPINVVTPPLLGKCDNQVQVSGLHYPGPNQNCTQTMPNFVAGIMGSFHFKSKCSAPSQLLGITNASCQNTPISGFPAPGGSVYQATVCCGTIAPPMVRFEIKKSMGADPIPNGTYAFNISCTGPAPYTGTNPVNVAYPTPGSAMVTVPAGDTCSVTEVTPAGSWNNPVFSGSGVTVTPSGQWSASVGPVNANGGVVKVTNQPREASTCHDSHPPKCGGACGGRDEGKICQPMHELNGRCGCTTKPHPCGPSPTNQCGGDCNDKSKTCQMDKKTGACGCSEEVHNGSLTVYKTVVNTLGVPSPASFSITANCTPPSGMPISTHLSVPGNNGVSVAMPIPANSVCSIIENPLPPTIPNVKACNGGSASWVTTYSAPVTIMANAIATATATNTLKCNSTGTGTLTIVKVTQPKGPPSFHFNTVGAGLSPFDLDDDPNTGLPNSKTFTNLAAGIPFTVTESAVSGWTVPSLQCLVAVPGLTTTYTDQLNRTFTVNLEPGANVTCTFINVKTP